MGRKARKKRKMRDVKTHPPEDRGSKSGALVHADYSPMESNDLKSKPPDIDDKLKLMELLVGKLTLRIRKSGAQFNTYSSNIKRKDSKGTYVMDYVELNAVYEAGISTLRTVDVLWDKY